MALAIAIISLLFVPSRTASVSPQEIEATKPVWTFDTLVSHLSKKYGQNESLVRKIIDCESDYRQGDTHKNYNKKGEVWSIDWGLWQINDYWHLKDATRMGYDVRYNWKDNLEYGFIILKRDGAMAHWSASAYCWNK